jgi:hypothetical protein
MAQTMYVHVYKLIKLLKKGMERGMGGPWAR